MSANLGILFPGQGAQYVGQGKAWFEKYASCRELFAQADDILGFALSAICFAGTEDKLQATDIAQPAIFLTSVAVFQILQQEEILNPAKIGLVAGLSLGEYTALYAAGSLSFADGLRLVRLRGQLMQRASQAKPSSMTSILGLDLAQCETACAQASTAGIISVANLNSPGQIVISGELKPLAIAEKLCLELGAKRAIRLQVAGAFHSAVMKPAAEGLAARLETVALLSPKVPFLSNVTADEVKDPAQIRDLLAKQLYSPVLWEKSMRTALDLGVNTFIEPAPGKVLKGLLRKIEPSAMVNSYDNPSDLPETGA